MLFFWTAFHGFQRIVGEISRVPWLLMRGVWQDNDIHYDASLHNMRDIAQGDGSKCDWRQAVLADSFLYVCKQISGLWLPPKHRPMAISSGHPSTSLAQHPFDSLACTVFHNTTASAWRHPMYTHTTSGIEWLSLINVKIFPIPVLIGCYTRVDLEFHTACLDLMGDVGSETTRAANSSCCLQKSMQWSGQEWPKNQQDACSLAA